MHHLCIGGRDAPQGSVSKARRRGLLLLVLLLIQAEALEPSRQAGPKLAACAVPVLPSGGARGRLGLLLWLLLLLRLRRGRRLRRRLLLLLLLLLLCLLCLLLLHRQATSPLRKRQDDALFNLQNEVFSDGDRDSEGSGLCFQTRHASSCRI
jgi:hypothetical protein